MNLFDIIGPVMVGPSSSHTAGAVKIGFVSRRLMGCDIRRAEILFYGSFRTTGRGHGTNLAVVAGLLGMHPDDDRIPHSLEYAKRAGMEVEFGNVELKDAHPNSVLLRLTGVDGKKLSIVGESVGGSLINIAEIDGLSANFTGDNPTLIAHNDDEPGHVAAVTSMLAAEHINIATMQLYRKSRGGTAVMVIETDQEITKEGLAWLRHMPGINKITYYSVADLGDTPADRMRREDEAAREQNGEVREAEKRRS